MDEVKIYENHISADTRTILAACRRVQKHMTGEDHEFIKEQVLAKLEKELERSEYLTGNRVSVIDIVVFNEISKVKKGPQSPRLDAWFSKLEKLD